MAKAKAEAKPEKKGDKQPEKKGGKTPVALLGEVRWSGSLEAQGAELRARGFEEIDRKPSKADPASGNARFEDAAGRIVTLRYKGPKVEQASITIDLFSGLADLSEKKRDQKYDEFDRTFGRAVKDVKAALGAPEFEGEEGDDDCPEDLGADNAAVWSQPYGRVAVVLRSADEMMPIWVAIEIVPAA